MMKISKPSTAFDGGGFQFLPLPAAGHSTTHSDCLKTFLLQGFRALYRGRI